MLIHKQALSLIRALLALDPNIGRSPKAKQFLIVVGSSCRAPRSCDIGPRLLSRICMPPCPENPEPGRSRTSLRPEQPGDEAFLYEIFASTRAEELALTGWDTATRAAFLDLQFRAMRRGYAEMFPHAAFSIVLADGQPAGRLVVDRSSGEMRVVDIALLPAFCGQGIGAELMGRLLVEAAASRLPVRLRALHDSRALRFYRRLGFASVGDPGIYQELEWRPA